MAYNTLELQDEFSLRGSDAGDISGNFIPSIFGRKSRRKTKRYVKHSRSKSRRRSKSRKAHSKRTGKIKYTKNGQPYKILSNGRARFIKGRRHKR